MAITAGQVTTSSTLEQFRVEFNKLQTDVSGIEAGSLSFTNISATQISVAELTVHLHCQLHLSSLRERQMMIMKQH